MSKQKMTIEDLAVKMDKGFVEVHKTIEDLALMTQRGFEAVDKRFEAIEGGLGRIEGRLDAIEMEIIDIKKRMREMPTLQEFELLKERVVRLEKLLQSKRLKSA